jgi:hypothetical protein
VWSGVAFRHATPDDCFVRTIEPNAGPSKAAPDRD